MTSAHNPTNTLSSHFAAPLAVLMLQGHESVHVRMQQRTGDSSFGESIGSHVSSVEPEEVLQDALVEQLSEILDVTQEGLLGRLLDEGGRDGREDRLRI